MNLSAQNSSAASEQADFFENKKLIGLSDSDDLEKASSITWGKR